MTGALYRARAEAKGQPVFSVAVADFFNEPVVDEIDLAAYTGTTGDPIKVSAHDDFEVTGVVVAIRGTDGTVLEQGPAVLGADGLYTHAGKQTLTAGQNVVIEVTATDRPGHKGTKTQAKGWGAKQKTESRNSGCFQLSWFQFARFTFNANSEIGTGRSPAIRGAHADGGPFLAARRKPRPAPFRPPQ